MATTQTNEMFTQMMKMFSPEGYQSMWQQNMDMSSMMTSSKQTMETMKQASSLMADTMNTCMEQQFKMMESCMNESIEAMRDMSTAQGIEELMAKQSKYSKQTSSTAQDATKSMLTTFQKGQTQAMNMLSEQMMTNWQTMQTTAKKAATTTSK